jgi:hypothetical protein
MVRAITDHTNHLAAAGAFALAEQFAQQKSADSFTSKIRMDVDGVLERMPIRDSRSIKIRVRVANHSPLKFRDQVR